MEGSTGIGIRTSINHTSIEPQSYGKTVWSVNYYKAGLSCCSNTNTVPLAPVSLNLHEAWCYVYGLCLPLWTYLWTDKWVTVWKRLRTSLGTPLCILFRLLLTYWHFLMLLGMCTVHRTLLTEGSVSASTLDSCMVQETSMADGSASKVLQTCVLYCVLYMETYFTLYCTWQCHIGHTCI